MAAFAGGDALNFPGSSPEHSGAFIERLATQVRESWQVALWPRPIDLEGSSEVLAGDIERETIEAKGCAKKM